MIKLTNTTPKLLLRTRGEANGNSVLKVVPPPPPPAAPDAPTGVSAIAGNLQAFVSWTHGSEGTSPVTGYTVVCEQDGTKNVAVGAGFSSAFVTGLTAGTSYTFHVYATNAVGNSPDSTSSSSVTVFTYPTAPTGVGAVAGTLSATVSWTASTDNGSPITGYTVVCEQDGTKNVTVGGAAVSANVTGLTAGTPYTFHVYATNGAGDSSDSSSTSSVTPTAPVTSYTLVATGRYPALGNGPVGSFPEPGWTSIFGGPSQDDNSFNVTLPFTWYINGSGYTSFWPGSNTYITFGVGSSAYSALGPTNPTCDKIHIAAADNSWQRLSSITSGTDYVRVRYEGYSSSGGTTPGNSNIIYEITFFNPASTGGVPWAELLVGYQNRGTTPGNSVSGICGPVSILPGGEFTLPSGGVAPYTSYVMVGDATGSTWAIHYNYHVGGTDY